MLRRFRGESVHKVDQKGRVSVPAPFRRVLEEGDPDWTAGLVPNLVLIYGMPSGNCLEGYTIEGAARLDEKVSRLPQYSPQRRYLERIINTQSTYAQIDENGRIVLPQRLRDMFGLDTEGTLGRTMREVRVLDAWPTYSDLQRATIASCIAASETSRRARGSTLAQRRRSFSGGPSARRTWS